MDAIFVNTTAGLDYAEINLINWASRVQVFQGTLGRFYVGVPAGVRNTGVKAVKGFDTVADALTYARTIVGEYTEKMNRIHARALKMNAKVAA